MKISDLFILNQGHQITDEEIYNNPGNYPVYTGNNEVKGYWNKKIVDNKDLPCITYPTKANPGVAFIQHELFDSNNTAILVPKREWRDRICLDWFKYKLPSMFQDIMTSKEGVSYLNKEIVEDIEINLPDIDEQILDVNYFRKLDNLKQKLINKKIILETLISKSIAINFNDNEEILISKIFKYISRNDMLSEQGVYNNSVSDNDDGITVLSGSTKNMMYGKVLSTTNGIHYLKEAQCLHVITRGKAGFLTYLDKGTYATNTNANLIYIEKENWDKVGISDYQQEKTYLKFMKIYLQPLFYQEVSKSDNGVFAVSLVINKLIIPLLKYNEEMKLIVSYYEIIKSLELKINESIKTINNLINREIIRAV